MTSASRSTSRTAEAQPLLRGLPPVLGPAPRVLVLGSMPGAASLARAQYYAHPRNVFWPIVEALLGIPASLPYAQRLQALRDAGVALWDVIGACRRQGSLDARIERESLLVNPVAELIAAQPTIRAVLLNGGLAARLYRRHVRPALAAPPTEHPLPSTSPAHAARSFEQKLACWRVLGTLLAGTDERAGAADRRRAMGNPV